MAQQIPVVDLFAGPGGLGEGFGTYQPSSRGRAFNIVVSAEKDAGAHKTLRLRAFARSFGKASNLPQQYYDYVSGEADEPFDSKTKHLWEEAAHEAQNLTLGDKLDNKRLSDRLAPTISSKLPWVLIGGPPCQAYSLVGRARNAGNKKYVAESDHRHYLYREYLEVIRNYWPAVFVMENVKGLLSSSVDGDRIVHRILADLSNPEAAASGTNSARAHKYKIYSLVMPVRYEHGTKPGALNLNSFVIRSEEFGVPQRRHRIILLGVRDDFCPQNHPLLTPTPFAPSLDQAIRDLPAIRSRLSRNDSLQNWIASVESQAGRALKAIGRSEIKQHLPEFKELFEENLPDEAFFSTDRIRLDGRKTSGWADALVDPNLPLVLNHKSKSHMDDDLGRYLFVSAFGRLFRRTPKTREFPSDLASNHSSWESGGFADRFRVQLPEDAATTITSHIAKDGHYYIHHDLRQCRSLSVREAARIQTFPDNYFFEAGKTSQFTQVGNAVPPILASQIAAAVYEILR